MCFPVRNSTIFCLNTVANSGEYLQKKFIKIDREFSFVAGQQSNSDYMDLFDHKTIQFEGGPSLAFHLIKKACQRNKHLKMKLTPLLEFPKHRITLILVETLQKGLASMQRRGRWEGSPIAWGGHNVIKLHLTYQMQLKNISTKQLSWYKYLPVQVLCPFLQNTKSLTQGMCNLYAVPFTHHPA